MIFRDAVYGPGGTALRILMLALATGQLGMCITAAEAGRKWTVTAVNVLIFAADCIFYILLLDGTYTPPPGNLQRTGWPPAVTALYGMPFWAVLGLVLLSAAFLILCVFEAGRAGRTRVLPTAVKETVDMLPLGICFFEPEGAVLLSNLRMTRYAEMLTGRRLRNASAFRKTLSERGKTEDDRHTVRTEDGRTLVFSESRVLSDGKEYGLLTASDMTDEIRLTEELAEKNRKLRDIQRRMKAYQAREAEMFMEQENLAARIAVHDNLGGLLLHCRYYFENPGSVDENALLLMMRETNAGLLRQAENDPEAHDVLAEAVRFTERIGVSVCFEGNLPESGSCRALLAQAVRECAANTVKHADGSCLLAGVSEENGIVTASFTNDGAPPEGPVTETGGLLSLRRMTENAGGSMIVEHEPVFRLTLAFPAEGSTER